MEIKGIYRLIGFDMYLQQPETNGENCICVYYGILEWDNILVGYKDWWDVHGISEWDIINLIFINPL